MPTEQTAFTHPVLTVRVHAGLNAASLLAGLWAVSGAERFYSADTFLKNCFPAVDASLEIRRTDVRGIGGVTAVFGTAAPEHGHVHRSPANILDFYARHANLTEAASALTERIWLTLAQTEASVHGADIGSVHFHEVGRTGNILAVGLIAELFAALDPSEFVSSPLPLADGTVRCAHGFVPNPAPAALAQLEGVAVCPYAGSGETVSPTGIAILKGLGATFGAWPAMCVTRQVTAFAPGRVFEGANGLVFALGRAL